MSLQCNVITDTDLAKKKKKRVITDTDSGTDRVTKSSTNEHDRVNSQTMTKTETALGRLLIFSLIAHQLKKRGANHTRN